MYKISEKLIKDSLSNLKMFEELLKNRTETNVVKQAKAKVKKNIKELNSFVEG